MQNNLSIFWKKVKIKREFLKIITCNDCLSFGSTLAYPTYFFMLWINFGTFLGQGSCVLIPEIVKNWHDREWKRFRGINKCVDDLNNITFNQPKIFFAVKYLSRKYLLASNEWIETLVIFDDGSVKLIIWKQHGKHNNWTWAILNLWFF